MCGGFYSQDKSLQADIMNTFVLCLQPGASSKTFINVSILCFQGKTKNHTFNIAYSQTLQEFYEFLRFLLLITIIIGS